MDRITAWTIIAEVGVDMQPFANARHLASWAGLCPGHRENGRRLCLRKGAPKAVMALAHHRMTIGYHILAHQTEYVESGADSYDQRLPAEGAEPLTQASSEPRLRGNSQAQFSRLNRAAFDRPARLHP